MLLRTFFLVVAVLGKADLGFVVEKTCYRRIISGKRLHERFIRHSLPCNSLEACQHQCSIEKHFDCQGFNIRLDPARVGRGICELSSVATRFLDFSRDFVFDPEFVYYEKDRENDSPNCGHINRLSGGIPQQNSGRPGAGVNPTIGGPYYGGDSYGPWSTGHGTVDHGPWGSRGYGSGFYESNNPSRGPAPSFLPDSTFHRDPYDYAGAKRHPSYDFNNANFNEWQRPTPTWTNSLTPPKYPLQDKYDRPWRVPTYIIIDADANKHEYGSSNRDVRPYKPNLNYLPQRPQALPPPTLPPPTPPPLPPPAPSPPPWTPFYKPFDYFPRPQHQAGPGDFHNDVGYEVCFRRQHAGYKLNPSTIRQTYDTPTVLDCEAMCTKSPFECTGYSYRYSSSNPGAPNCLLTDSASLNREIHLLPDRSCDVYFKMNTCADNERIGKTECFLKVASDRKIDLSKVAQRLTARGMSECELACLSSRFFTCRSFSFRYGPAVIGEPHENCFLSDWPMSALRHSDFVFAPSHEVYERGSFGHGCELDVGPPHIGPETAYVTRPNVPRIAPPKNTRIGDETWKHFTVNGWPCRFGTQCQLNREAGFWGCEVEGGDRAQWDYCCRPKHSCGFSKGYQYPWCYVGEAGPDQWRPCSEFYFPDFDNRQPYRPVQSHNPDPADSYGPPTKKRPWNFGEEDYGPPSHWPIAYLHADPPPNETIVWDPEEFHLHYHHLQEEHFPQQYHEHLDDGPQIKFKACGHKVPYPRAIVQKLDLKNKPSAGDPGKQLLADEKPRFPKKVEPLQQTFDSDTALGFSSHEQSKKNKLEFFPSIVPIPANSSLEAEPHRESHENASEGPPDKTKEVVEAVEKIIRESVAATNRSAHSEKNETLTKDEARHPNFMSIRPL